MPLIIYSTEFRGGCQRKFWFQLTTDPFWVTKKRKANKIEKKDIRKLFFNLQKESQKNEAAQMQRRHERKKEKRKKSARLQLQVQEQKLDLSQTQTGTTGPTEDIHIQPQPAETPPVQTEKPPKTVIKTEPKTPKARARLFLSFQPQFEFSAHRSLQIVVNIDSFMFRLRRSIIHQWSRRRASVRSLW